MKCIALLLFFVSSSFASIQFSDERLREHWTIFKEKFNKRYLTDEEELIREEIFLYNLGEIINHNIKYDLGLKSYRMAINKFTDLSEDEFAKMYLNLQMPQQISQYVFVNSSKDLPTNIDWRLSGMVTPVQDQGDCGSCYAFSSIASLEGQHKKKTGNLVKLSEQQIVDCSSSEGDHGCGGGLMDFAFQYIKDEGGIDTEECYPYVAKQDVCNVKRDCFIATVTGFVDVESKSESALQEAVATIGPISVAVDASDFQHYSGGIFDDPSCGTDFPKLNHAVTVVGYGADEKGEYWIVKNSWGVNWGIQGYILMSRNKNNQCGIATAGCYPLV